MDDWSFFERLLAEEKEKKMVGTWEVSKVGGMGCWYGAILGTVLACAEQKVSILLLFRHHTEPWDSGSICYRSIAEPVLTNALDPPQQASCLLLQAPSVPFSSCFFYLRHTRVVQLLKHSTFFYLGLSRMSGLRRGHSSLYSFLPPSPGLRSYTLIAKGARPLFSVPNHMFLLIFSRRTLFISLMASRSVFNCRFICTAPSFAHSLYVQREELFRSLLVTRRKIEIQHVYSLLNEWTAHVEILRVLCPRRNFWYAFFCEMWKAWW